MGEKGHDMGIEWDEAITSGSEKGSVENVMASRIKKGVNNEN